VTVQRDAPSELGVARGPGLAPPLPAFPDLATLLGLEAAGGVFQKGALPPTGVGGADPVAGDHCRDVGRHAFSSGSS